MSAVAKRKDDHIKVKQFIAEGSASLLANSNTQDPRTPLKLIRFFFEQGNRDMVLSVLNTPFNLYREATSESFFYVQYGIPYAALAASDVLVVESVSEL